MSFINRRKFLQNTLLASASVAALPLLAQENSIFLKAQTSAQKLPRWRGFNLLEKFVADQPGWNTAFREKDFEWMREWGFDFVRIPMSYHCWMKPEDWHEKPMPTISNEKAILEIDQVIEFGRQYGIHVNLNLHRIQGYCVNTPPNEPLSLWKDEKALDAAVWQWKYFAERYKNISSQQLSFDLINEPANVDEPAYVKVVTAIVNGIRSVDASRLIVADGLHYGTIPVFGLADLNIGQSTRGYNPMQVSHYQATWVAGIKDWKNPAWDMKIGDEMWNKAKLKRDYIEPWKKLEDKGVGIHVGEWGCYKFTPHTVALRWMEDNLSLWKEADWGWSLWNLRGDFGILNSGRKDVKYENYEGEKLDRKMLELLQKY
jgi:endoglucanase